MAIRFRLFSILPLQLRIVVFICFINSCFSLNCTNDPCMYGICLDNANSSYSCYCIDGYTGINCEINFDDCWSTPCLNGGTCNDAVAAYNCTCPDDYIGTNCEQKYSECMNQPCLNNGTCIDYNGFTCQCQEGYSGEYCEIDISVCNTTICKNGGECIDGPGYSYSCQCREGWTGELCEVDVDECLSSPCENGGLCLNIPGTYTCACLFGFTGKNCDKVIVACEQNPCANDAMCLLEDEQPTCYCVPDYHGQLCELRYNDCESKFAHCENGGTCIDGINSFTCSCPPAFTGETCSDHIPTSATEVDTIDISKPGLLTTTTTSSSHYYTPVDGYDYFTPTTLRHLDEATKFPSTYETTFFAASTSGDGLSVDSETESPTVIDNNETYSTSPVATSSSKDSSSSYEDTTAFETTTVFQIYETKSTEPITKIFSTTQSFETIFTSIKTPVVSSNETEVSANFTTTIPLTWSAPIENTTSLKTTSGVVSTDDGRTSRYYTSTAPSTIKKINDTRMPLTSPLSLTTDADVITVLSDVTSDEPHLLTSTTVGYSVSQKDDDERSTVSSTPCPLNDTTHCCNTPECKQSAAITNAAFNGKSYIRQQVNIDENGLLKIYLRVKTKSKSGIIMHAFFDEERYVLLYMELGQLKFQFSCGLQTMLLGEIDTPINNGRDVDIEMRFRYLAENEVGKCAAKLFVNDSMAMSGEQMLSAHEAMPRHVRLHLGGIPQAFSHYFPRIGLGFIGCMSLMKVNDVKRHFILDSTETFQVEECTSFLCLLNPCRNFGSCHDINGQIHCRCITGYTGEFCERTVCDDNPCYLGSTCITSPGTGFICVCPLGMHGLRCEEESTIVQPSFSVFIPGFSSYVAYGINAAIKDYMELKMRIIPHSIDQISLIAYMGQSGSSKEIPDHFSVTYVKGYIMLTWDLGSGVRRIFTKRPLSTRAHKPHTLHIGRRGRDAWLFVDGIGNVTGQAAGTMTQLDVSPLLYIGGHKSKNFEALPHDLPLHTGFTGCIYDIEVHTEKGVIPVSKSSPASGRGVGECHRNECTHNTCKNGAVCLNHGPTYSCICMKEWRGPECSIPAITCSSDSQCQLTNI
ncbi:protein eyes shut [Chelonus insularis]|uniref:protein eyes shut n=1 Tax=Chelonus insularis TaxID=460826 RepID=UPI00158AB068|nr:protein eyes shut-like [Chelonus insularis]